MTIYKDKVHSNKVSIYKLLIFSVCTKLPCSDRQLEQEHESVAP